MFEKICEMLADKFDVDASTLTVDTKIKEDLQADSLDIVELMMDLEEECGVTIPDEEAAEMVTIGDLMKYIEEHHGIRLPIRTVGEYLKRWGYTPQKPIKVAYEQKPEAVKEWLVTTYPSIAARAKAENAEIHWADETAVMNTDVRGRSYAPRGKTPTTCTVWGARQRFSMISSVNNQGKCYWMVINGVFNADRLIEFMESLIKDVPRKVFLVMDNLKVHHCKPVMAWLEEHKDRIEVFYLPSYSPELNPDERLNADLKHAITTGVPKRTRQGLRKKTEEHMTMVASTPEHVKSYFKDKHVRYAADSQ